MQEHPSILVVDDHSSMRKTLEDILQEEGYDVDSAASGEEAVDLFSKCHHDAVLMDVRMSGINGVEAFRRMKGLVGDAKVILMSAFSMDELKEESLREGVLAFLPKPLDMEHVIGLIRNTIAGKLTPRGA